MDLTTWGVWSDLPMGWPGVDRTVGPDDGEVGAGKIVGVDADRAVPDGPPERFGDPFVGRVAALALALETFGGGFGGVVPVVLVSGEAGVGKSRLAHEVTARVPQRTVWSSCWEGDGAPPFWPWLQVLRALRAEGVEAVRSSGDPGSLGELLGVRSAADAQAARFRLFDAFADVAAEATSTGPLLVVIDDLQWADAGSLRLLRFLRSDVRAAGLAVLATCREGDDADHATGAIANVVGELAPGCVHLRLGGLDEAEVAQLCEQLGVGDLDAAALHRRSGGNPFYVREFTRIGAGAAASVPASVAAVVGLRLDAIPDAARETLGGAAVLGAHLRGGGRRRAARPRSRRGAGRVGGRSRGWVGDQRRPGDVRVRPRGRTGSPLQPSPW